MEDENKILDWFELVKNNIVHPFVVFDKRGNIVSFNSEADNLFEIKKNGSNIFNFLKISSSDELAEGIEELISGKNTVEKQILIETINEKYFNSKAILSFVKSDLEDYILLTLVESKNHLVPAEINSIKIPEECGLRLEDSRAEAIIDEIKRLYPFTFIGKERVRKLINELDTYFWIKSTDGRFILVNDKVSRNLGINPNQIEGKGESGFIAPFLSSFFQAVEEYIIRTNNCLWIDGFPFAGIKLSKEYSSLLLPLTDSEGNVNAVIGCSIQRNESIKRTEAISSKEENKILLSIPKPVLYFTATGIIRYCSKEFSKLFGYDLDEISGKHISQILPVELTAIYEEMISNNLDIVKTEKEIRRKGKRTGYFVNMNRITGDDVSDENIILVLEEKTNELENLIKNRGVMFEFLIQNNPEPILIYDKDNWRFLEVNKAAQNLYGYGKEEFLNMDLADLYSPEDIQTLIDPSGEGASEGKFYGPYRNKKKDGSSVYVEISKVSIIYNDKDAVFNIVKDVTDKIDSEKKNQLFKSAFDNTEDLIFVTDNTGLITYVNKAVCDVLNYKKGDLESYHFATLVPDDERATINTAIFQSYVKDVITIDMELKGSRGNFVKVELTATPVLDFNREVDSYSIICKTEKGAKSIEYITKEVIKEVVVEKPVYIKEEKKEVKPTTDVGFLSNIFHEILTPINVILGFVQELTESINNLTPEQKEAADIINQNRVNLLNTMNNIVEYVNLESSEVNPTEIRFTDIIDKNQKAFNEVLKSNGKEIGYGKISTSLKFLSDREKFEKLVLLAVSIAGQISKEKKIYIAASPKDEETFSILLKDNTVSATKALIDGFNFLFNLKDDTKRRELGLPKLTVNLAKSLLELLNGSFEVTEKGIEKYECEFIFPLTYVKKEVEPEVAEEDVYVPRPYVEEKTATKYVEPEVVKEEPVVIEAKPIIPEPAVIPEVEPVVETVIEPEEEYIPKEDIKSVLNNSASNIDLSNLNCLYIEDQVDSQILFQVQMKGLRDLKFAVSLEEALPLLDDNFFDFIVMDINLQGEYNGLDALKIIHKMPKFEHTPIIAVTAYVLPGDREKFIATGFTDFISKPIFREKMVESLEKIFDLKRV